MTKPSQWVSAVALSLLIGVVVLKPVRDLFHFIYLFATEKPIREEIILCRGKRFDARLTRINDGGATVGFQYEIAIAESSSNSDDQHIVWDSYRIAPSRLYWQDRNTLVVVFPKAALSDGWRKVHSGGRISIKESFE